METPQTVAEWLQRRYPKPLVDMDWVRDCCTWLVDEDGKDPINDFAGFIAAVDNQFVSADLHDSMQANTGLDHNIGTFTGTLQGPPILVQITAITDVGHSAFQLEQVRVAREERMRAHVGDEEGDEEGDIEIEGEGPMPKYPRGMLRFQLSDGTVTMNAIEYRPIPQVSLGNTALGYKLQLKQTRVRNGIALLEPATIRLVGGECADMESNQLEDLRLGLRVRRGLPLDNTLAVASTAAPPSRSPLRDISPPPAPAQPPRDMMESERERPRRVPIAAQSTSPTPPSTESGERRIAPLRKNTDTQRPPTNVAPPPPTPSAERATLVHTGLQSSIATTGSTTSPYFGTTSLLREETAFEFSFRPTVNQVTRTIPPSSRAAEKQPVRAPPSPSPSPSRTQPNDASSDYGDADFDMDLLVDIDRLEQEALAKQHQPPKTASSSSRPPNNSSPEVIEILSDDESADEGKENKENRPVTVRNVRQRVVPMELDDDDENPPGWDRRSSSRAPSASQLSPFPLSQHRVPGRPRVLASRPEDIIELSD